VTALLRDFRLGVRMLRQNPGFCAAAIATLALGIGATTVMFSVIDGVLLKPLRYRDADRIVQLNTYFRNRGRLTPRLTGGDLLDLRQANDLFEAVSDYGNGEMGVQLPGHAEFVGLALTSPEFLDVFGVAPLYGRSFRDEDAERSAVVSLPFAQRNFASGDTALGKSFAVEGRVYTIIGVVDGTFQFPQKTEVWLAQRAVNCCGSQNRTAYNYHAVAKLRSGVTVDAANARLTTLGSGLEAAHPDSNQNKSFRVVALRDQLVGPVRNTLYLLMSAVALVLLIACGNAANLMLARATARWREIAVRSALGAARWDIVRQLLAESLVLGFLAAAVGVMLASIGTSALLLRSTTGIALPRLAEIAVDTRVLLFAIAVAFASSIVFGLAPAFQAAGVNVYDALKDAGARGIVGGRGARLRSVLLVGQIALSLVLVISAGLLFRSFLSLTEVDLGFRSEGLLAVTTHIPARTEQRYVTATEFEDELFARLRQLPGVTSVGAAMGVPAGPYGSNGAYAIEGRSSFDGQLNKLPQADFSIASPSYFATMGIPLKRGRDFNERDRVDSMPVVIISESVARQNFAGEDPLGHRIQCGLDQHTAQWMTIVGVVGDVRQDSPASQPGPALYFPLRQHPERANELQIVLRGFVAPEKLAPAVQQTVRAMNPEVPLKFLPLQEQVGSAIAAPRFRMLLTGIFAGLALLLALMGVYAVMTYITAQRTAEFAVRAALGASPRNILQLVLGRALRLALIGIAIGVVLAVASSRLLTGLLFGLKSTDATTYAVVLAAMVPVVLLAATLPAWRASRVDPMVALRSE
jgi:predicted permease